MIYGWNWRQLNWYLLISSSRLNVAAGFVQMNEKRRPRSYPPQTKPIHNNSLRISNKWKHQHHPHHQPSVCLSVFSTISDTQMIWNHLTKLSCVYRYILCFWWLADYGRNCLFHPPCFFSFLKSMLWIVMWFDFN